MQLEVTEKEALAIYSDRYLKSRGKLRYLLPASFILALVGGIVVIYYSNNWLGLSVFAVLYFVGLYFIYRMVKASKQYAQRQIEGIK